MARANATLTADGWLVPEIVSNRDVADAIGIVGDSLLYYGIVPGAFISMGTTIAGVVAYYASLQCSVATTGTLEYRASDKSVRFTAPGDSAGAWVQLTSSKRQWISSADTTMQAEIVCLYDTLGASDGSSTLTLTPNPPYTLIGWRNVPTWFEIFSGQRCQTINAAAPGAKVQHLSDLLDDLRDRETQAGVRLTEVWIQAGTNDFSSGATPTVATMLLQIAAACRRARQYNWTPRVFSVPMRDLSAASAAQIAWRDYNRQLPETVRAAGGIYNHIWQHLIDPAISTAPLAGMTTDNIHPSGVGAFHAAVRLWSERGGFDGGQSPFQVSPIDAYNVSTNPSGNLLPGTPIGSAGTAGTGGTATDVATTWDVRRNSGSITIVGTKQTATDGGSAWQVLTFGAAAAITDEAKYEYNLGVGTADADPGDTVELFAEMNIPANAGIRRLAWWITTVGASRNDSSVWDNFDLTATYPNLPAIAWPGAPYPVVRLPRFKIATGTTSLRVRFLIQTAVGATPVAWVRQVMLRKV